MNNLEVLKSLWVYQCFQVSAKVRYYLMGLNGINFAKVFESDIHTYVDFNSASGIPSLNGIRVVSWKDSDSNEYDCIQDGNLFGFYLTKYNKVKIKNWISDLQSVMPVWYSNSNSVNETFLIPVNSTEPHNDYFKQVTPTYIWENWIKDYVDQVKDGKEIGLIPFKKYKMENGDWVETLSVFDDKFAQRIAESIFNSDLNLNTD